MKSKIKTKKNSGQSLIEFIFCVSLSFGMITMFVNFALTTTSGYIVHYATFMAGRVYLVADNFSATDPYSYAESQAQRMFTHILGRMFQRTGPSNYLVRTAGQPTLSFNRLSTSSGMETRPSKVLVGVFFKFAQRLSLPGVGTSKELNMVSESFLGKEPTRAECLKRIKTIMYEQTHYTESSQYHHSTLFDNGC